MLLLEQIPLVSIDVRIWKFLSIIFPHPAQKWRAYAFVVPTCIMNAMQFVYLCRIWGDLEAFTLNLFFVMAIFDALMRTCLVICFRNYFETMLVELAKMYIEIMEYGSCHECRMVQRAVRIARRISIFNLISSIVDIFGAVLYPIFSEQRVHPFGVALPTLDMTAAPIYEIFYFLQLPTPFVLTLMYMPYVNLFAALVLFARAALQVLQYRLGLVCISERSTEAEKYEKFVACIEYYARIERYINKFNSFVTYIVGIEFLIFSGIICMLLICLNNVTSPMAAIPFVMYILTMVYVLFTYYWHANELIIESDKVSDAVYNMPWYDCSMKFRKTVLIFIMITQRPLMIRVGNLYPMTLATFQSVLNASYSYFTMLRGVTSK